MGMNREDEELVKMVNPTEVVLDIQHLLGCCILGETNQRRSAPVTKFSQPRA